MQKGKFELPVEHMTDLEITTQALVNAGDALGGATRFALHAIATEIKRLKRVQEKQKEARQRQIQEMWAKHAKAHGVKHPDDDIPF